jgi:hypothetical protein
VNAKLDVLAQPLPVRSLIGKRAARIKRSLQSGPPVLDMREDAETATPILGNQCYRAATNA